MTTGSKSAIAILNVGGRRYRLLWSMIMRRKYSSRLRKLYRAQNLQEIMEYCDDFIVNSTSSSSLEGEYFFDRHAGCFDAIVNMMRFGVLYYYGNNDSSSTMCVIGLMDELQYWGIELDWMPDCCRFICRSQFDDSKEEYEKVQAIYTDKYRFKSDDNVNPTKCQALRTQLWELMDEPDSSLAAKIMTVISITFIIVSTATLVVSTIPIDVANKTKINTDTNSTNPIVNEDQLGKRVIRFDDQSGGVTDWIEQICIVWFTVEYLIRIICCPKLCKFLVGFMNIIDLVAIVPFYLCLIINLVFANEQMYERLDSIRQMMQLFRVLRILRILKFARHSIGLQSLGYTLKMSYNELGMLMMFIGMGSMLFSCLVFFAERDMPDTQFTDILSTNWWAIISMTTVGYGDMSPETSVGRIVGALCCVVGVLIISLPIPIIVSNFAQFYQEQMREENTVRKRREMETAVRDGCVIYGNDNTRSMSFFVEEERRRRLDHFFKEIETVKYIDEDEEEDTDKIIELEESVLAEEEI